MGLTQQARGWRPACCASSATQPARRAAAQTHAGSSSSPPGIATSAAEAGRPQPSWPQAPAGPSQAYRPTPALWGGPNPTDNPQRPYKTPRPKGPPNTAPPHLLHGDEGVGGGGEGGQVAGAAGGQQGVLKGGGAAGGSSVRTAACWRAQGFGNCPYSSGRPGGLAGAHHAAAAGPQNARPRSCPPACQALAPWLSQWCPLPKGALAAPAARTARRSRAACTAQRLRVRTLTSGPLARECTRMSILPTSLATLAATSDTVQPSAPA